MFRVTVLALALLSAGCVSLDPTYQRPDDAPRDKCAHFREINGIAAAFQYLQKNYIPTALSFL